MPTRALPMVLLIVSLALGAQAATTRNVAIVVWNGAEILDWGGPSEVFESASRFGADGDTPAFQVYTVSKTTEPIVSQRFITVTPQYSITDAPKPDIIVLPGGGTGSVLGDPEFLAWVGETAKKCEVAMSVCTGAFLLGKNGLLEDQDATTWYGALDGLEQQFPEARVHRGRRFVDNGQILTTAGVSAGIDGALHLVARLLGRNVADRTAEYMEYKWAPESYLAQNYSVLNPQLDERGQRFQQADIALRAKEYRAAAMNYRELLRDHRDDARAWYQLGAALYGLGAYADAGDAYLQASVSERSRARSFYNAACSFALAEQADQAFDALASAIEAGMDDRDFIESDEDFAALRDDPRFAAVLGKIQ